VFFGGRDLCICVAIFSALLVASSSNSTKTENMWLNMTPQHYSNPVLEELYKSACEKFGEEAFRKACEQARKKLDE
jgi:hypothetical protein